MQLNAGNRECLVYVFRHGETDWNVQGRLQGHSDVPLNENGKRQAHDLARRMAQTNVEVILSSDSSRALETANTVAQALKIPIVTTAELREIRGGDVEGVSLREIGERLGPEFVRRMKSVSQQDLHTRYPGGESKFELVARALMAIQRFISSGDHTRIAVSTHGGVLRQLAHACMSREEEPIPIPNCVIYCFRFDPAKERLLFIGPYGTAAAAHLP